MALPVSLIGENSKSVSLLILRLGNIPNEANFKLGGIGFLIKNITDEDITATVVLYGQLDSIETVFYPGWNPEVIKEVVSETSGLQYGY